MCRAGLLRVAVAIATTCCVLVSGVPMVQGQNIVPLGPEFAIGTDVYLGPRVARNVDGSFVAVWVGSGASGEIFARLYDSDGMPAGAEFQVNTYTTGIQVRPDVALDGSGNFVVVWEDGNCCGSLHGQDGEHRGIVGRRFDGMGAPLGGEFLVNSYTTGDQKNPSVAMDDGGNFVVVWEDDTQDGEGLGVIARRYDSSGAALGTDFIVNTYTTDSQSEPAVAMDAVGNFLVTWQLFPGPDQIRGQRYDSTGAAQGAELEFGVGTPAGDSDPDVGVDGAGNYVVVWQRLLYPTEFEIVAQRLDAAGTLVGTEFRVSEHRLGYQNDPRVAVGPAGGFVVVWWDNRFPDGLDGSESGIFRRTFDASGAPLETQFQVNSYTTGLQRFPDVAMDGSGNFVAVWNQVDDYPVGQRFYVCDPPCPGCERCEPGGGCVVAPRNDCHEPTVSMKARLRLRDADNDAGDSALFKWIKGEETLFWELGDPTTADDYGLCIYETVDAIPTLIWGATAPAAGVCPGGPSGRPCWRATSSGFKYKDRDLSPDGIQSMRLKHGDTPKPKMIVKGRGGNLDLPSPLGLGLPVRAQLQSGNGKCWEATFFESGVVTNDADSFNAKAGSPSGAFLDPHADALD